MIIINGRLKGLLGSVALCLLVSDNILVVQYQQVHALILPTKVIIFQDSACACNSKLTSLGDLLVFITAGAFAWSNSKIMILLSNSCVKCLRLINSKFE